MSSASAPYSFVFGSGVNGLPMTTVARHRKPLPSVMYMGRMGARLLTASMAAPFLVSPSAAPRVPCGKMMSFWPAFTLESAVLMAVMSAPSRSTGNAPSAAISHANSLLPWNSSFFAIRRSGVL